MGDPTRNPENLVFPERERLSVEETKQFIEERKYFDLKNLLADALAPDIVEIIENLDISEQVIVFRLLNKETAAEVFSLLDHDAQEELLINFGEKRVKAIFEEMDPDDLTELFDELPDKIVRQLIRLLPPAATGRQSGDRPATGFVASRNAGGDSRPPGWVIPRRQVNTTVTHQRLAVIGW